MKSPRIMYAYAGFLVVCGIVAYVMAPPDANATTALIGPIAFAALMVACGVMASKVHQNRKAGMFGIHVGMVLPLLLAALFSMLAYRRLSGDEPVVYLGTIFAILTVASIIAFIAILLTRPKPEARV